MGLFDIFEESFSVLRVNKMRTLLSILGIVIGIGSVITLVTLGQASQKSVTQQIQAMGANLLTIRPGSQQQGFLRMDNSGSKALKLSDAKSIAQTERINTIQTVAADFSARKQVSYERTNNNVQITGVWGDYFELRNIEIAQGATISSENYDNYEKVAVLGATVATDLFGENANPLGTYIRISGTNFRVIGVTKSKGESMGSPDELVYIPLSVGQKVLFGNDYVNTIYVGAKNENLMSQAQNQVSFYLLELHNKKLPEDADFSVFSQQQLLDTVSSITGTFTTLLSGIAAISLVVGGIGIMNIMLVTVTERTSEIGLRKALGAKRKSIIAQFLTESIILTVTGGFLGITIGLVLSLIMTAKMALPTIVSWESILLAFGVSSIIGIVFGWYPAQKASKLPPIEALRYE